MLNRWSMRDFILKMMAVSCFQSMQSVRFNFINKPKTCIVWEILAKYILNVSDAVQMLTCIIPTQNISQKIWNVIPSCMTGLGLGLSRCMFWFAGLFLISCRRWSIWNFTLRANNPDSLAAVIHLKLKMSTTNKAMLDHSERKTETNNIRSREEERECSCIQSICCTPLHLQCEVHQSV